MLKLTKTGIGLLTRQYRSVLRKCFLINIGVFALGAAAVMTPNEAEAFNGLCADSAGNVIYQSSGSCPSGYNVTMNFTNAGSDIFNEYIMLTNANNVKQYVTGPYFRGMNSDYIYNGSEFLVSGDAVYDYVTDALSGYAQLGAANTFTQPNTFSDSIHVGGVASSTGNHYVHIWETPNNGHSGAVSIFNDGGVASTEITASGIWINNGLPSSGATSSALTTNNLKLNGSSPADGIDFSEDPGSATHLATVGWVNSQGYATPSDLSGYALLAGGTDTSPQTFTGYNRFTNNVVVASGSATPVHIDNGSVNIGDTHLSGGANGTYVQVGNSELTSTDFKLNNSSIRANGITATPSSGSNNLITAGGVYNYLNDACAGYVKRTGDTMSGPLVVKSNTVAGLLTNVNEGSIEVKEQTGPTRWNSSSLSATGFQLNNSGYATGIDFENNTGTDDHLATVGWVKNQNVSTFNNDANYVTDQTGTYVDKLSPSTTTQYKLSTDWSDFVSQVSSDIRDAYMGGHYWNYNGAGVLSLQNASYISIGGFYIGSNLISSIDTSISSSSTNNGAPTSKAVYDYVTDVNNLTNYYTKKNFKDKKH